MPISLTTEMKWTNCLTDYSWPKWTHDETEKPKSSIYKEFEFIIKTLPKEMSSPDSFTGEFYQMFKEEITPNSHFQKIEQEAIHFMRSAVPWYQNNIRNQRKRKLQAHIPHEYRCEESQQNTSTPNSTTY